jgi:hypothetical protein
VANLNPNQVAKSIQSSKAHKQAPGTFGITERAAAIGASRPSKASPMGNAHVTPGLSGRGGGAKHSKLQPLTPSRTAQGRARRTGTT